MKVNQTLLGHVAALFTITLWGTTFVSTKILLATFNPLEILFFRFLLGLIALYLIKPQKMYIKETIHSFYFAAAGLCGVTLYFLLENIALLYTTASNAGVIVAVSPLLTALFSHFIFQGEKLSRQFFFGFIFAILGICIISFAQAGVSLNPLGDLLAFLAACVWAIYSLLCKKIAAFGYNAVQTTRQSFFYGLIFMLPASLFFALDFNFHLITQPVNFFNLLYLGLGASALCFVTWNVAVKNLGALKTSAYIYAVPLVTILTAAIILQEKITPQIMGGTALTLLGLLISESRLSFFKK